MSIFTVTKDFTHMIRQVSAKNLVFSLLILLISALLFACAEKKQPAPSTVYIDQLKLPAEPRDISEYIEDMYVIPLETHPEALLGSLSLIEQDESGIFIVSGQKETVYHFSREGNYLNSFSHSGKGPGEYLKIRNMRIVPKTKTLLVSDARLNKMFRYTFNGELVKEFRLPQGTARFAILQNGNTALHIGRLVNPEGDNLHLNELVILDPEGSIVQKHFPYTSLLHFEFGNPLTRPDKDGTVYYSKQFDFNLYRLAPDGKPEVHLRLDYGSHMAKLEDMEGPDLDNLMRLQKQGKRTVIDDLINTTDYLLLTNRKDRKTSLILINKKSLKLNTFGTDTLFTAGDYQGFPVRVPKDSYQDHFFFVMDAGDVHEVIATLSEEQKRILSKKIRGFKQLLNIGIDDNPVLVFVRFKD